MLNSSEYQDKIDEIEIKVFNVELDGHQECNRLKEQLKSHSTNKNISTIILSLKRCFVEYATSFIFLDEVIKILQESEVTEKKLIIKLSIDEDGIDGKFWYFRYCKILNGEEVNDNNFISKLTEFFKQNKINVSTHIYNFNSLDDSDMPVEIYILNEIKNGCNHA